MLPQPRKLNPTMMAAAFQGRTVGLILFILLLKKVVVVYSSSNKLCEDDAS